MRRLLDGQYIMVQSGYYYKGTGNGRYIKVDFDELNNESAHLAIHKSKRAQAGVQKQTEVINQRKQNK